MGQYHVIYNKTKREYIRIGGAKLWEQTHSATAAALLLLLSNSNGRGGGDFSAYPKDYDHLTVQEHANQFAINLASGRWAGDCIVVQGDYAKPTDAGYIPKDDRPYTNITDLVCDALLIADNGDNSDVAEVIEAEGCGTLTKVKGIDRNNNKVELYQAAVSMPKAKRKRGVK